MSQITTHVLDTSLGRPGKNIKVELFQKNENEWKLTAEGITNDDGRCTDLLEKSNVPEYGIYKIKFYSGDYFNSSDTKTFYPYIEITFQISDDEHYHVPLLLNPFGYSTYRGS
ncbi:MAG TPA: hydroxyisourate hydrolase [Ignavibacteria bacterium]|nr:hydroxyisourate hydrolase [Ignavibacteria bacterium]HQY51620.1 hydroxyisourate hydrolase [Ignavibacteria bacterium]HRA99613.1 hydroxyisourate hydrolase [Ignavibacteria bacterium]